MRSSNALPVGRIGENRHICAFFHGEEERYRVLLPFVREGFDRGEKAVHIVDPELRSDHARRLESLGIDVNAAIGEGRLELETWDEAYLRGGAFDQERTLLLLEDKLSSAMRRGFPLTRLIAHMEWSLDGRADPEALVEYEARFNRQFPDCPDWVLCTYDLTRFRADVAIDVMRTHPLLLIGGTLLENPFYTPPDRFLREVRERKARRNGGH